MVKKTLFEVQPTAAYISSLTSSQLEQWFSSLNQEKGAGKKAKADLANEPSLQFGLVGLQSAQQVSQFLKTHTGQAVQTMINDELVKIELLKEHQTRQHLEEAQRLQQRLLYLLMGLMHKREAHRKHLNELIQQQLDKKLNDDKKALQKDQKSSSNEITREFLQEAAKECTKAIEAIDSKLKEIDNQLKELNKEIQKLNKQGQQMKAHHAKITAAVAQMKILSHLPVSNSPTPAQTVGLRNHAKDQASILSQKLTPLQTKPQPTKADNLRIKNIRRERDFFDKLSEREDLNTNSFNIIQDAHALYKTMQKKYDKAIRQNPEYEEEFRSDIYELSDKTEVFGKVLGILESASKKGGTVENELIAQMQRDQRNHNKKTRQVRDQIANLRETKATLSATRNDINNLRNAVNYHLSKPANSFLSKGTKLDLYTFFSDANKVRGIEKLIDDMDYSLSNPTKR